MCQNVGVLLDNRRVIDLRANKSFGSSDREMENGISMSSRQMGTWPQLIGCALFEIGSLISDSELRSRRGYSTGRLESYEISTENWEMVPGFPEHLRRRTRRT